MDGIQIQTTQNVDIEYNLASIGDRILSSLLDYLFFIIYFVLIGLISTLSPRYSFDWVMVIIGLLPVLLYDLYCEILFEGKSFGKMIMKIKVVKLDGTRASIGSYFLRWILRIIDTVIFSPGVALLMLVLNEKGQRLGDMAAGTTVVKLKNAIRLEDTILTQNQNVQYTPVFSQVTRLSDSDVAIIKEVLTMAWRTGNNEALQQLSAKTKEVLGVATPMPDMQFLNTILQDYTYLSEK